ncbi:MAG TPA: universal stress protein [Anaerolineales bacterium]
MTENGTKGLLSTAVEDFHRARAQAELKELLAHFTGESTRLLSYEDVRQQLRAAGGSEVGLQDIPLDAIVGSVGRYTDFTRDFLPRSEVNPERWARVKIASEEMAGLPPIEVYKIGDAYFVKDGNHRVSVARQFGAAYIQAYVTEIRTRVPLAPDVRPEDLILKAEYAEFLEQTHLDELRPDADLSVTVPGQYQVLAEHISVHRYFMGIDFKREIPFPEAVTHWYDEVYLPVVRIIREQGILHSFPNRTETDLYVWISRNIGALKEELGWEVKPEAMAADLVSEYGANQAGLVARLGEKLLDAISLNILDAGPAAGQWRKARLTARRDDRLFREILVPVSGEVIGFIALDQALLVAQREGARLHGLHVVPTPAESESEAARAIQAEFNQRCAQAGVEGALVLASGEVTQEICARARWTDLIVINLAYPPPFQPLARIGHGFREIIQRCSRPLLAVPMVTSALSRALLAYDGSPKADEALFVAAYLCGQWQAPLVVVSVHEDGLAASPILDKARKYLDDHALQATFIQESGPVAETILKTSQEQNSDVLILGGYGRRPVLEMVLGSTVDKVLRESDKPTLICR